MIDFHSHILPGIDDGSADLEQSIRMLEMYQGSGVDIIIATPHYNIKEGTIDSFIHRRDTAYDKLINEIEKRNIVCPNILKGCEVSAFHGMGMSDDIERLCIEGTRSILIELPFEKWSEWVFRAISNLSETRGMIPIIAHIERYVKLVDTYRDFHKIFSARAIAQVNSATVIANKGKGIVKKLVKNNILQLLGSDCHDDKRRVPNIVQALDILQKKYGNELLDRIEYASYSIIEDTPFNLPAPMGFKKFF